MSKMNFIAKSFTTLFLIILYFDVTNIQNIFYNSRVKTKKSAYPLGQALSKY